MAAITLIVDEPNTPTAPGQGALRAAHTFAGKELSFALFSFDFDASYPTGGELIDAATFPGGPYGLFRNVLDIFAEPKNGYTFSFDVVNKKLKAYQGDNANAVPAPSIEVAAATNLAAVTGVRCLVVGFA